MNNLNYGLKALFAGVVLIVVSACATSPETVPAREPPEAAPAAPPPAAAPAPAPAPEPTPAPKAEVMKDEPVTQYTVVRGDNLWDIAGFRIIYGNPYQWPLIFKANAGQIKDADLIYPNQVLAIPRNSSGADVEAAIQHAKTRGAWQLGIVEETDTAYLRAQGVSR